jgi:hypothetical protein
LTSAADRLRELAGRHVLAVDAASPSRYRFQPVDERLGATVRLVAETYRERRVTVVTLIYSKPSDAVRDLAKAFRLGKAERDG